VDAENHRCPTVFTPVTFTVEGPAEWRGGIAQGKNNYILSKILPAECGVNRALIRTTTQSGKVRITASADGLTQSVIQFETVPVVVEHGLNEVLPNEGLPSLLLRGETPSTPSYKVTRKSIGIVSATAGANAGKAALSYDDNELSEWTNDGNISTGWITYKLDREVLVSEVCLKLAGWRTRSYPITILVDGKEVWNGKTLQSLGYVNIPVMPTLGQTVTIRLTGSNIEKDAFQNMVEVSGKKELDLTKNTNAGTSKGQLRIIEAEFYEKME